MPSSDKAATTDAATADQPLTPEQEAALAAQVSADHAAKAAEQADKDDLAAKRAASSEPVCPNCRAELIKHEGDANLAKKGAWHCNSCGSCWAPGIKEQRAGHSGPAVATKA